MNTCKINKTIFSSQLDNDNLIHIQVKNEDKRIPTDQFQTLKSAYQQRYSTNSSPQQKAELAYNYIRNMAEFSAIEIKYNAVIEINCSLSYSLYLYVKTDQAETEWHSKLIPSEDINAVGPILHRIIKKASTD